jgi:DNA-binding response OmpR family regulator
MQERLRILVVEDDRRLAELIRDYLQQQGYQTAVERRGDRAVQRVLHERPELVVLDLMLPGKDGLTVLQQIRADFGGAVLIMTAREDDMDQVAGLEMGADDYVKKPIEPRVLLARIRALLRRFSRTTGTPSDELTADLLQELTFGGLDINRSAHRVTLDNQTVELTSGEFELLWLLASNAGTVLDRDTLFKLLRGFDYNGSDRSVDVSVSRLRKKLGDDSASPKRIKTIWGKGYLFVKDAW